MSEPKLSAIQESRQLRAVCRATRAMFAKEKAIFQAVAKEIDRRMKNPAG